MAQRGGCGSEVEPVSGYQKVTGFDSPGLPSVVGQNTEPQTAPDLLVGT